MTVGATERCVIPEILKLAGKCSFSAKQGWKKVNLPTNLTLLICSAVCGRFAVSVWGRTSENCYFLNMGSRHGCDGNCLLGRPLWRAFSYSSFSLKAAKGGPRILRGTQRVMHLPPCVEKDQWKKTGKLSGPRLRRQLGGQTGQKVAWGLTATESMAFAFISSLSSSSAVALIPVDQTQLGDICWLMDLFALSEDAGGCPTAMDNPWLCDWSYQWT